MGTFVLGAFIGLMVVCASVIAAVILVEPHRARRAAPQAGDTAVMPRRSLIAWAVNLWPAGRQRKEGSTVPEAVTALSPEAKPPPQRPAAEASAPLLQETPLPEGVGKDGLLPSDGAPSPPEETQSGPEGRVQARAEGDASMIAGSEGVSPAPKDGPPAPAEKGDTGGGAVSRGDWASVFTDVPLEESPEAKLAKTLEDIDMPSLLADCQKLTASLRGKRKG